MNTYTDLQLCCTTNKPLGANVPINTSRSLKMQILKHFKDSVISRRLYKINSRILFTDSRYKFCS